MPNPIDAAARATPPTVARRIRGLSDRAIAWLFVAPTIFLLLAINIFPLIWTVRLSFTNYRANRPNDAQMRFLKGVIQRDSGKNTEAIATFTRLTEDYPELPEPYNNLAVLYAGQSQFDKARTALEMAIRTNPSYTTAHENLGDVYAKLASQAYGKALQLDANNAAVPPKLALIRELFNPATSKGQRPASTLSTPAPVAPPPVAAPAKPAPEPVVSKPAAPAVPAANATPAQTATAPAKSPCCARPASPARRKAR